MKSFDTDLKKYADKISLKAAERKELRERILSYMEYHPLPKQALSVDALREEIPSEAFTMFHFTRFHLRVTGSVLALLLIVVPLMAERSAPGDVLYLVKTGFNETIQKQLADSPYEKIEFETKLMERRIAEARVLAEEGKLTDEMKTELAETVKGHTVAVRSGLEELRSQDADGAAIAEIAFNSTLEVQAAVLGSDEHDSNDELIAVVDEAREETVSKQEENKPSFGGLMAQVERETTRAYELFTAVKESATLEEIRDVERRLSDIDRITEEAKHMQRKDEAKGVSELMNTLGLTQKLIVFMTDIDVRQSVTLETLVPVVLSTEERTALAREELNALYRSLEGAEGALPDIKAGGLRTKIEEGLEDVKVLATEADATLLADVAEAEKILTRASALMADLTLLANGKGDGSNAKEPSEDVIIATEIIDEGTGTTTPEGTDPMAPESQPTEPRP